MPSSLASQASSANSAAVSMEFESNDCAISADDSWPSGLQERINAFQQNLGAGNTTLNLSGLGLVSLPGNTFDGIAHQVTGLNLAGNKLTTVPDEIAGLINLISLELSANAIISLPDCMARLANLEYLSLYYQRIPNDLDTSSLTEVPGCIAGLKKLKTLVLSDNALTYLDPGLGELCNLQELLASNNKIVEIPSSFGHLSNLRRISLVHNKLTAFPIILEKLHHLQEIYLAGNCISSFRSINNFIKNWKIVDLENNQLDNLDHIWAVSKDCKIFLSGNPIAQTLLGKRSSNRELALNSRHAGIELDSYENVMTRDLKIDN